RCYIEKDFDFGEDGLLLLSGMSGSGKSSLLLAITFVRVLMRSVSPSISR
ncbi:MAG: hypothetical protein EBS18_06730, partial [Actinobacteria bacterium]|nr:hypothetical protein [Actinomycetota bacterium]